MSANAVFLTVYLTFTAAVLTLALAPVDRAPFRFVNRAVTDIRQSIRRMLGVEALSRRLGQRRALGFIDLAEHLESAGLHDSAEQCRDTATRLITGGGDGRA